MSTHPRSARPALAVLLLLTGAGTLRAADDHGAHRGAWWETVACCGEWPGSDPVARTRGDIDEATGRSLLNYPPHRFADHLHMRLSINIPDMNSPTLEATEVLTLSPLGMPLPELTLNCGPDSSMHITGVQLGASAGTGGTHTVSFTHTDETLSVRIDPPMPVGERFDLLISYTLTDPPEGMTWTPESPAWPGRPAQLHTQGQPESNRYWFPCHDSPNERLSTELVVTVPSGFNVISNGKLLEKSSPQSGRETFHWLQASPHANYLVTLVVGKFDVVDVGSGSLPMPVFAPLGHGPEVQQTYGRTPTMIRTFERILDEPYPWDKYAQIIVHNFAAGGMENTSATSMYDTAILDKTALLDGDLDGLISHELAHQWFGDLMTCNSWEHIWLNEGFATYFSHVWFEERDGMNGYLTGIYGSMRNVASNDKADAPFQPAMCSKEYSHPWDVFRRAANPYPKGASILHMLRVMLGDDIFVQGLRLYVDRCKHKTVETDDLRYAFEEASGRSLVRFFRQWCERPGVPHVDVNFAWDPATGKLSVNLKQTQNIDGYNPAFFFTLPIWVQTYAGKREGQWIEVPMDGREASASFDLPGEPVVIAVDPRLSLLASLNIAHPADRWIAQLETGPTIASQMQAIDGLRALGKAGAPALPAKAGTALAAIVRDTKAYHVLRSAAARALRDVGGADVYLASLRNPPSDARVRLAIVEQAAGRSESVAALGADAKARMIDDLRNLARRDESYAVRAAAVSQLGEMRAVEGKQVIFEAANAESQHDQIRRAALGAIADLDDAAGLPVALQLAQPGRPARTRPEAVRAIARLAHFDQETALNALVEYLRSPEERTARAAGDALVKLGGARAEQAIQEYAASARGAVARSIADRWVKQLADAKQHADAAAE